MHINRKGHRVGIKYGEILRGNQTNGKFYLAKMLCSA